ncbi:MAG: aminoacyl-histidine dipeptidase [Bacteroidetes bacterium]|jgi:dipeptidase D|nr:aminoacyl-histidine dipeptidase [Bacteroidota bacterium]
MASAIDGLKPEPVWRYFAEISKIPRPSKHEERMTAYVQEMAKKMGLTSQSDKYGNVVVRKPASPGKEQVKMICLQGHLDMVPEKNKDKAHDFMKDPIELVRKGNMLMANGTTLGADNGIAVATMLAIMEDKKLVHGPLEFLFTVDEETGLTGANHLKGSMLQSRTMMNLDSEEEGSIYVGCSGGKDCVGTWKLAAQPFPARTKAMLVTVKGLRGGHSGLEIDKNRGNAIKIMNRVLLELSEAGVRVASFNGGNKRNAIPREAEALVAVPAAGLSKAKKMIRELEPVLKAEVATVDPDLSITIAPAEAPKKLKVWKPALQQQVLRTIAALPHGVIKMSSDIAGLVETSTNVAVITTDGKAVTLGTSQRSSVASEIREINQTARFIFTMGGAKTSMGDGYPGWKPNLQSAILQTAKATYKQIAGKEAEIKAIHAGLECGIIGEKVPGMDMISFGPTLEGVHSPDEKIHIDTVERFWNFLLAILRNVN